MGGEVRLSIVKPDGNVINNVTWTGADMTLFISEKYVNNDIDGAIENVNSAMRIYRNDFLKEFESGFENKSYDWTKLMAPHNYGLTVIDFPNKIIRSLQDYNYPAHKDIVTYIRALESGSDEPFAQLTANNSLVVVDKESKERYSFEDFFGTTDPDKICRLIDYIRYNENQHEFQNQQDLKIFSYKGPHLNYKLNIIPHNLDFEIVHYYNDQYGMLLSDLIKDGHKFSEQEKNQWINHIKESMVYKIETENPKLTHKEVANLTLEIATKEVDNAFNNTNTVKPKMK